MRNVDSRWCRPTHANEMVFTFRWIKLSRSFERIYHNHYIISPRLNEWWHYHSILLHLKSLAGAATMRVLKSLYYLSGHRGMIKWSHRPNEIDNIPIHIEALVMYSVMITKLSIFKMSCIKQWLFWKILKHCVAQCSMIWPITFFKTQFRVLRIIALYVILVNENDGPRISNIDYRVSLCMGQVILRLIYYFYM